MKLKTSFNLDTGEFIKAFPKLNYGLVTYLASRAKPLFIQRFLSGGSAGLRYKSHGRDVAGRRLVRADTISNHQVVIRSYPLNLHERKYKIIPKLRTDVDSQLDKWAARYDRDTLQKALKKL